MVTQTRFIWLCATLAVASSAPLMIVTYPTPTGADLHDHNSSVLESVCYSMLPYHDGSVPQQTPPPYSLTVSKKNAVPGDSVQVIIYGKNDTQFGGVYIQARNGDIPVGQFLPSGPNTPPVTLTDCPPGNKNVASYISNEKITQLILSYVVPKNVPAVVFRATLVESFSKFWIDVFSEEILVA